MERSPRHLHTKCLVVAHRDPATSEKGHNGQSGQLGLQPHFQVCLICVAAWQFQGPSAEHSPSAVASCQSPAPASLALPSSWRLPAPPHCPERALDPTQCSQAPSPTYHPQPEAPILPLGNFARMGHSSQVWEKIQIQRVWGKGG